MINNHVSWSFHALVLLTLLIGSVFFAPSANAQDKTGIFFGAKYGGMEVDEAPGFKVNSEDVLTWVIGLDFGNGYTIELEQAETEFAAKDSLATVAEDLEFKAQAAYLSYRTQSKYYYKLKGGYLQQELDGNAITEMDYKESGFSWGLGVGGRFNRTYLEIEYLKLLEDVDTIAIGMHLYY